MLRSPHSPTLFPYTTLFRSRVPSTPSEVPYAWIRRVVLSAIDRRAQVADQRDRDPDVAVGRPDDRDRKSTRLNSSHGYSSYAVFCLKKKIGYAEGPRLAIAV